MTLSSERALSLNGVYLQMNHGKGYVHLGRTTPGCAITPLIEYDWGWGEDEEGEKGFPNRRHAQSEEEATLALEEDARRLQDALGLFGGRVLAEKNVEDFDGPEVEGRHVLTVWIPLPWALRSFIGAEAFQVWLCNLLQARVDPEL